MEMFVYNHGFSRPVFRTIFPNGMEALTAPLESKLVALRMYYTAGALDEETLGTAHYLEHMMMRGAAHDGIHPFLAELEPEGVSWNAGTSLTDTYYRIEGFAEHGRQMMKALCSILRGDLHEHQMERERAVILQEARSIKVVDRFSYWGCGVLYPKVPRLKEDVIGNEESIKLITFQDVVNFRNRYQLNQSAFFAAGGLTHDEHLAMLKAEWGEELLRGNGEARKRPIQTFTQGVRKAKYDNGTKTGINFFFPCIEGSTTPLVARLLSHELNRILRNQERMVYGVDLTLNHRYFPKMIIEMHAPEERLEKIQEHLWEVIQELKEGSYSEVTWKKISVSLRRAVANQREAVSSFDMINQMSNGWAWQDWEDIDAETAMKRLTREDVMAYAQTHMTPEQVTILERRKKP